MSVFSWQDDYPVQIRRLQKVLEGDISKNVHDEIGLILAEAKDAMQSGNMCRAFQSYKALLTID